MNTDSRMHVFRSPETTKLMRFCPVQLREALNNKICGLRAKNKDQATISSKLFCRQLQNLGMKFTTEVPLPAGGRLYFIDILITEPFWIAIEIDGGVHKKQVAYDSKRDDNIMRATGWLLLRFTNEQVESNAESMWSVLLASLYEIGEAEAQIGSILPIGFDERLLSYMKKYVPSLYRKYRR